MTASPKFPHSLAALPQWVCWRLEPDKRSGRDAKVPYNPHTGNRASASNPSTWGTLTQALTCAEKYHFSGVGFMFTEASTIVGIDIDNCLDENKKPNTVAAAILKKVPPTYIEISPSGTGLHIFLRGRLPPGGNRNSDSGVEMYGKARYFTMTGVRWRDCADEIADDNGALSWIHSRYILKKAQPKKKKAQAAPGFSRLTDDELLKAAQASKDGDIFSALWNGDWQGRYKSQSEADFALCCKLAFWSNRDEGQMDRLFRRSGLHREKWDTRHSARGATYGETTITNACAQTEQVYTSKRKRPVNIYEQDGGYYRKKGETIFQLTNFLVRPLEIIRAEEEVQLTCDFIADNGEVHRQQLLGDDFINLQKFKKILNRRTISLSFFGTEGDLEAFKDYLHTLEWNQKKGVKALGIFLHREELVFVTHERAIAAGGRPVDTIVQLEKYRSLDSKIIDAPLLTVDQMLWLGERLLSYNEPAKTVSILAWAAGCFVKPHLRKSEQKYPHLFLIGEAGSGKSDTLLKVLLPIFSRSRITSAPQVTPFTLMEESDSSNVIPQAIDEFKPSTLDKQRLNWLHNHFRGSYDQHQGIRGRADQTVKRYDLLAPLVVAGEESAEEAAIRERTIELLFSKKDLSNPEHERLFKQLTKQKKWLASFGRSLLDIALQTEVEEVEAWYAAGEKLFDEDFPDRVVSNLACVHAGLMLVKKMLGEHALSWDGTFPVSLEACCNHLTFAAKEYLLDGGNHNRSIVEQTFEIMARMKLKPLEDFAFEAAGKHLCLWLCNVYDRYTRYRKDYAIAGEVLTLSQFRKQLQHSNYFVAKQKLKRMGPNNDDYKRVWVVDFERLSQAVDLSGFLRQPAQDETNE